MEKIFNCCCHGPFLFYRLGWHAPFLSYMCNSCAITDWWVIVGWCMRWSIGTGIWGICSMCWSMDSATIISVFTFMSNSNYQMIPKHTSSASWKFLVEEEMSPPQLNRAVPKEFPIDSEPMHIEKHGLLKLKLTLQTSRETLLTLLLSRLTKAWFWGKVPCQMLLTSRPTAVQESILRERLLSLQHQLSRYLTAERDHLVSRKNHCFLTSNMERDFPLL